MRTLTPEEQAQKAADAAMRLDSTRTYFIVWEQWHTEYKIIQRTESFNNVLKWLQAERKAYGGVCSFAMRWGFEPESAILVWDRICKYCDTELTRLLDDEPPVQSSTTKQHASIELPVIEAPPIEEPQYFNMAQATAARIGKALQEPNELLQGYTKKKIAKILMEHCRDEKGKPFVSLESAMSNQSAACYLDSYERRLFTQVKAAIEVTIKPL